MGEKQKPSHSSRIQTPSIPDLADGITLARIQLNARKLKHRGRKLKDGPLINGLVAWFLGQTHERQADVASWGLRRYEAILNGELPLPDCAEEGDAEVLGSPKIKTIIPTEGEAAGDHERPKKRRRPPRTA